VRDASQGLDASALAAIGIDLDAVRRSVEESFGPGALSGRRRRRGGHLPLCPKAKRALERSLREALALSDRHIGPEHILLGLASDADSGAARARELRHDARGAPRGGAGGAVRGGVAPRRRAVRARARGRAA
jgi:hypothetical protein